MSDAQDERSSVSWLCDLEHITQCLQASFPSSIREKKQSPALQDFCVVKGKWSSASHFTGFQENVGATFRITSEESTSRKAYLALVQGSFDCFYV